MATGIIGHKFVGFLSIWNAVKEKVYKGRMGKPFKSERELKQKIRSVWGECAKNKAEIRKAFRQFIPRLKAVVDKNGFSIKTVYE